MFASTLLVAFTALAGLASAQNYSMSGMNLTVDLSQVPIAMRQSWCTGQRNTCPAVCNGSTTINVCDPNTLIWDCKCSNGPTPNISDYQQSAPAQLCREWVHNCVANHPNDLDGQDNCLDVICGNRTDELPSTMSTSSAMMTSTAMSSAMSSSTGTPASTSASNTAAASPSATTGAAVAMHVAENYGLPIVGSMMLAIFGLVL